MVKDKFNDAPLWQHLADAIAYRPESIDIKNMSFGEAVKRYGALVYPTLAQVEQAMVAATAQGTILVQGAANSRGSPFSDIEANANKLFGVRLPETIAVAAIGSNGTFASYSNFGSNITVTAPSSSNGFLNILSTETSGETGYNSSGTATDGSLGPDLFPDSDYTSLFGGTSASAPLVSGILALTKQSQPSLNTRFAKHLLARTSRLVDPGDAAPTGGWSTNGAGYHFNNNYGFGLIDADALTREAVRYTNVTPLVTSASGLLNVGVIIPDNNPMGVTQSATFGSTGPLEEVQIRLILDPDPAGYAFYEDIQGIITSPSGTQSAFLHPSLDDTHWLKDSSGNGRSLDWTYTTNAFWGEDGVGTWTVTLIDVPAPGSGVLDQLSMPWRSFEINLRSGSLIPVFTPGDFNFDGFIDAADYVAWRKNPGAFPADAYVTWRAHFGSHPGSGATVGGKSVVPEPPTLLPMIIAGTMLILRRRNPVPQNRV